MIPIWFSDKDEYENSPKKVLFVLPSLASGGAERVVVQLLKHLDRTKFAPELVLFEKKGEFLKDIPGDIPIYDLKKKSRYSSPNLIRKLAKIIRDTSPSLIVGFLIYANFVILLAKIMSCRKVPVIIAEHSVPIPAMKNERMYLLRKWLYRFLYPKAKKIITVSKKIKIKLINYWNISSEKIEVVHNAVDLNRIESLSKESVCFQEKDSVPKIIAVGRLSKSKGYSYLLKAIKQVREDSPVRLLILGDGERRKKLEDLAKQLKIFDAVSFMGFQKNPYKYIAKATFLVSSSLWESFGIVLVEAMACGVPVIATRCPYGPEEIITDGVNGLLVPTGDVDALAKTMLRLLKDSFFRKCLVEEGKKRTEDFRIEKMATGYEQVFEEVIKR